MWIVALRIQRSKLFRPTLTKDSSTAQIGSATACTGLSPICQLNAYFATVPGNYALNLRQLYLLNTNYADLSFLFTILPGEKTNAHLGTEYLAVVETDNRTPYFLNLHTRDVAHTLILGMTGSGKTTLLRILADFIPEQDRIVVIEDTSELHIQKPNILAVECQTDTFKANISFDDLLKSALRWRPDRIILGEVRGIEARTLLDSFNTGHAGSLATIHANSAEKALRRFANLVMRNHAQTTFCDTEAEIGEAVDLVDTLCRLSIWSGLGFWLRSILC